MMDSCTNSSPTLSFPLAASCAIRAEVPVPPGGADLRMQRVEEIVLYVQRGCAASSS
jgi:hypothetical protein